MFEAIQLDDIPAFISQMSQDDVVGTSTTKPYQLYSPSAASWHSQGNGQSSRKSSTDSSFSDERPGGSSSSQHSMKSRFVEKTPLYMLCAESLGHFSCREKKESALAKKYISPNSRGLIGWQFFDIDRAGAADAFDEANVAVPNVIIENTKNGHAHYGYALEVPVSNGPKSHKRPMQLLSSVRAGMVRRLGADPHFTYGLNKNPLHADWRTTWLNTKPHTLNDIAVWLEPEDMQPLRRNSDPTEFAERGRNCSLTWDVGKYAIRIGWQMRKAGATQASFLREIEAQAVQLNSSFADPLGYSDVRSIARSAAKWAWSRSTAEKFSEIQSIRAQIRSQRNWAILDQVPDLGSKTAREVAEILGRSERTAQRYTSKSRAEYEANSLTRAAPWVKMGISRRTYYRRHKSA